MPLIAHAASTDADGETEKYLEMSSFVFTGVRDFSKGEREI